MNINSRSRYALRDLVLATFAALFFFVVVAPDLASAATDELPPPQRGLALPNIQLWTLLAGSLVPLISYVLNKHAPWVSEPVKAIVQVVVAAVAGGISLAIQTGDVGFNDGTLQVVLTSVIAALFAHRLLWRPSGISAALGGGSNVQDIPSR